MNFQVPSTTAAAPPTATAPNASAPFSFGLQPATGIKPPFALGGNTNLLPKKDDAAKPITFGAPAPITGITGIGGFSSTPAPTSAAPTLSGFTFGTAPAAATTTSTLPTLKGFGTTTSIAATPLTGGLGGFNTTATPTTTPLTGGLGGFNAAATPATTSGTGTAAAAPAPNLNITFGVPSTAATTKSALPVLTGFGAPPASATSTPSTGFALTKTTAAPTLSLGSVGVSTAATAAPTSTGGFASLSTATKTTNSAAISKVPQITYNQLEEYINKWTLELEEQEKVFTEQATQINAWDKVLVSNNQKIAELNDAVQKVKNDQLMVEQELEFISTQHKELEESIAPLQKEYLKLPQVDVERSQTYLMVENLDTQLKQMSEDLKEIIDNLNEANKGQDSSDPIIQVGKILNAHMSSLQWIEASTAHITNKLEDIDKMHESFKRDSERSFRSAYYN